VIADQVGYREPGALRRVLRREMGVSPRELRNAQLADAAGLDALAQEGA